MSKPKYTPAPTPIRDIARDFLIDNEIIGYSPNPDFHDKNGIDIHTHDGHTIVVYEYLDENDNVEGIIWELYKNDEDSFYGKGLSGGYMDIDNASSLIASILNNGNTQNPGNDPVVPDSQTEGYEIIDHETARLFIDNAWINGKKLQWGQYDIDRITGKDCYAMITYSQGATSGVISEKVPVEIAPLFTIAPDLAYTVEYQGKILEKIYQHLDDGNVLNAEQFHNIKKGSDDNEL